MNFWIKHTSKISDSAFLFMAQFCLTSGYGAFLHLASLMYLKVIAYGAEQCLETKHERIFPIANVIQHLSNFRRCSPYLIQSVLLLYTILFSYILYHISVYFAIFIIIYTILNNHFIDNILVRFLENLQFDIFEGLEFYYVIGTIECLHILLSVVFITWTLVICSYPLLIIVFVYTNVYQSCHHLIHDVITKAFMQWSILARFERASQQELVELDDVCSICLLSMSRARKTPCRHYFHGHCLRTCIANSRTCPICNARLY